MRKCAIVDCKEEATYIWQPAGPGETPNLFVRPGYHFRGFPAVPICDPHYTQLVTDTPEGSHVLRFTYRKVIYVGSRHLVYRDAPPEGTE